MNGEINFDGPVDKDLRIERLEKELEESEQKYMDWNVAFEDAEKSIKAKDTRIAALEKIVEDILALESKNPYPPDIFIEPSPRQFQDFNARLKLSGLSPDAYNGSMGRRTWNNLMAEIKKIASLEGKDAG